ncbi:hypothetical protein PM03_14210 [Thalassobacter stenotrophicus]|uniref:bifunctional DNA primase/polymerase n=1 Tax=Thalassobacter stenotrophicus TaxID=266809 RepID=UPI00051FAA80|nr:bifunctional DNA primase/polymerase [Thalassobacter stenotrophicus]KGK78365.1 hypothetical protein PM03_14210 [Thalassobacter stenotrophicus]
MTAQQNPALPDDFTNELARLSRAGFPLLPLGGGADGKAPLLRSWAGPKMTLSRVLAPLYRSGSQVYGVRLDGLAVIDCDENSPELVAAIEARFGPSPVHVKTPRGRHLYYRANGKAPNLRGEGLPVDIKTGPRAYVVGPLSERPDGGQYWPAKGLLGVDALPLLRAPNSPPSAAVGPSDPIPVGYRHGKLIREAVQMVEFVDSPEELLANLQAVRDDLCADAFSFPDSEVTAIAAWAWELRLKNRIYRGRDSEFRVDRRALDALRSCDNETDAIALYMLLVDMHGHSPGKRFPLDFEAMRRAGLTRQSVRRLRAARGSLQAVGLLKLVGKHRAGSQKQTFTLNRLMPSALNVSPLPSTARRKDRGEGL